MRTFKGKSVRVTGASSGIGKAFAETLAAQGARLIFGLISRQETRKHCRQHIGMPRYDGAFIAQKCINSHKAGFEALRICV